MKLDHAAKTLAARVIMHTSDPGGFGSYVSKIVVALAECGVPVVLFCPANSNDEAPVRAAGVEVVHAAHREVTNAGLLNRLLRNFKFLFKTVRTQLRLVWPGDIVHFQGMLHLPLGFVFLLLAKLRGGAIVLTAHDPMPHRWILPRALRRLERGMLQSCYKLCDRIIVHNKAGQEVLVREFHQQEGRISVVPHGWYAAAEAGGLYPAFDCFRLLAFGSIRENKGVHLAIQAVQMAASISLLPVRLTIAGDCDVAGEQYWKTCKQLIADGPDVIDVIKRRINEDEVGPLVARHHALVLAYTHFFSESGVAALALSHRRPILATSAGGLGELTEQGNWSVPIVSATVESVCQAILAAVELGPERLRKMGTEGREFMRQARSWDSIARQTAQVYSQARAGKWSGVCFPSSAEAAGEDVEELIG